jgi:CHAT domain-containing protein
MHPSLSCPAPAGSFLPEAHRNFLFKLLRVLEEAAYRASVIHPMIPSLVEEFDQLCTTADDFSAWSDELNQWVRWRRLPGYWLTFIFQSLTCEKKTLYHFLACTLYAQAQIVWADDYALSSLETAYINYIRNETVLDKAFEPVKKRLITALKIYHDYHRQWSRPFAYRECNPCADHLYFRLTATWLQTAARDVWGSFHLNDADALREVIATCEGDDGAYFRLLARRFLGLLHAGRGQHEESLQDFQLAWHDAHLHKIDTEIGHLRRLMGYSLRATGQITEAQHQFKQAFAFEEQKPFFEYTFYWQALSTRELGDTLLWGSGPRAHLAHHPHVSGLQPTNPVQLLEAVKAYGIGRRRLDGHMTMQCPFPLARAAKQQIMRSFSFHAIQAAALTRSTPDLLAEVEVNGPREVTELVTEMEATQGMERDERAAFRLNRAKTYKALNTLALDFNDYLSEIERTYSSRRAYLKQTTQLKAKLIHTQSSDEIVDKILKLRLPNTLFLLFHLGPTTGMLVVLDMESGRATPHPLPFGEHDLLTIHHEYENRHHSAAESSDAKNAALKGLLASYATLLGPTLEPILKSLPGKHVKIFPRLQMNSVPFHAIVLQKQYLIEHCVTLSYGQTLGLFLDNHASSTATCGQELRYVIGENVPLYACLRPRLRQTFGHHLLEEERVTWPELLASIARHPARDTVFACHGVYAPESVTDSSLILSEARMSGTVRFDQVFAELDLRGCRSVVMGACESGRMRTTIAAECLGLPAAMLASGVKAVVGALWTVPQGATAVLMEHYLESLKDEASGVCEALSKAQCKVMRTNRDQLAIWVRERLDGKPKLRDKLLADIEKMDKLPFREPYQWAGLISVGDV